MISQLFRNLFWLVPFPIPVLIIGALSAGYLWSYVTLVFESAARKPNPYLPIMSALVAILLFPLKTNLDHAPLIAITLTITLAYGTCYCLLLTKTPKAARKSIPLEITIWIATILFALVTSLHHMEVVTSVFS